MCRLPEAVDSAQFLKISIYIILLFMSINKNFMDLFASGPVNQGIHDRPGLVGIGVVDHGHQHITLSIGCVHIPGYAHDIAQTAGFQVRRSAAFAAL
jgi:hypothetical protein